MNNFVDNLSGLQGTFDKRILSNLYGRLIEEKIIPIIIR